MVYLQKGENIANLSAALKERLADEPAPGAVFVDGLENILPRASEAGRSAFVANLNAYRNALPAIVPCPLILWVSDWLLGVLARSAPDFFSIKSGIYFFRAHTHGGRELSQRASETAPNLGWENVPRDELRARADKIRAFLDTPRATSRENSLLEVRLANRLGDLYLTLYQLGDAEAAYTRSLSILEEMPSQERSGTAQIANDLGAVTYHQLGRIAEEQRDFAAAEGWYRRSLEIKERRGNEHGAASTYHQLGRIAEEQRDFVAAEGWYRRSLEIKERQGNEHGAAITYHQLGRLAEEQHDFAAAEGWYRRSLEIKERRGDEHGAASTYSQLGIIAGLQDDFANAGVWLLKGISAFIRVHDERRALRNTRNFLIFYRLATDSLQTRLKAMWEAAQIGPFPSETGDDGAGSA